MTYSLTWLPAVLRAKGLKVAEVAGWKTRGRREMGPVLGVMCHHTAGPLNKNMPSLRTLVEGRTGLAGPLAQLGLGRDGTYYVIAAGRCNHAGAGVWQSLRKGNSNFIGIEAENTGVSNDSPWPAVQMDAYRRGAAAILERVGRTAIFCAGHKEFAPRRKIDPSFDMDEFRAGVAALMSSHDPRPQLIPATEPPGDGGAAGRPTLRRRSSGPFVDQVQKKLPGVVADGFFGPVTEAAVRAFQRARGLVPDGIVGPKTWEALDAA